MPVADPLGTEWLLFTETQVSSSESIEVTKVHSFFISLLDSKSEKIVLDKLMTVKALEQSQKLDYDGFKAHTPGLHIALVGTACDESR